jgi:hypothetical protein
LAINAKGVELIGPKKRTAPLPPYLKKLFQKGGEIIQITKTLLTAKGRTFSEGAFIEPKEKHLKRGRIFKILKMLLEIIFLYHWLIAKVFEKTFPKDLQKQASGANVVQNVKLEESNHIYLENNWFNSK